MDVREAMEHSKVVATMVVEVGIGVLAVYGAILKWTPRYLTRTVSDG